MPYPKLVLPPPRSHYYPTNPVPAPEPAALPAPPPPSPSPAPAPAPKEPEKKQEPAKPKEPNLPPLFFVTRDGELEMALGSVRRNGQTITGARGAGKTVQAAHQVARDFLWEDPAPQLVIDPGGTLTDYVVARLVDSEQTDWSRVVYVPLGGYRDEERGETLVSPTPFYFDSGTDESETVARRFVELIRATDDSLANAPIQGMNAVERAGIFAGQLLWRMGCQVSELPSLIEETPLWKERIERARDEHPDELAEAADYWLRYPALPERDKPFQTGQLLAKALLFSLNRTIRAQFGGGEWAVPWDRVEPDRLLVLFDCRSLRDEHKLAATTWILRRCVEYLRGRGPNRRMPVSLVVDELGSLLENQNPEMERLMEVLIAQIGRSYGAPLTALFQSVTQFSPRMQKLARYAGIQLYAGEADPEGAVSLARALDEYDPFDLKYSTTRNMPSIREGYLQIEEDPHYYTLPEQEAINADKYRRTPALHFWCGVAGREGELPGDFTLVSIKHLMAGPWPDANTEEAKRRLARRSGRRLTDVVAEIGARRPSGVPAETAEQRPRQKPRLDAAGVEAPARPAPRTRSRYKELD